MLNESGSYPITSLLVEDGRKNLLLQKDIPLTCKIRLLHGMKDQDVPWDVSLRLAQKLITQDVYVYLIKDGDHRLSREEDLQLLQKTIEEFF
ncbi:MAG: hypothetical protein HYS39_01080 [Proteobacteria bacterium]|nr:hypothetical protein [Pseudomonadota bacterium]